MKFFDPLKIMYGTQIGTGTFGHQKVINIFLRIIFCNSFDVNKK